MSDESNTPNDDDDDDFAREPEQFEGAYIVDDDTLNLIQTVVGVVRMAGMAQVDETARNNLEIIADALAERFGIEDLILEEQIHTTEEGEEELLYRPVGGVFGDDEPEQEGEAPAVDSE